MIDCEQLEKTAGSLAERCALKRPLVAFALESTGVEVEMDRIVEMAFQKIMPSGACRVSSRCVNPGFPIPAEAAEVHWISEEHVAGENTFAQYAEQLDMGLRGCDLAGFNIARFDIPLLECEFRRAGVHFSSQGRHIVDVLSIYHQYHSRDLVSAVRDYIGQEIEGAHQAMGDPTSTMNVLDAQLEQHEDLPRDVEGLDSLTRRCKQPRWFDEKGKLIWFAGELHFRFGKCKGKPLTEVHRTDPGYLHWILRDTFSVEIKSAVRQIQAGYTPQHAA